MKKILYYVHFIASLYIGKIVYTNSDRRILLFLLVYLILITLPELFNKIHLKSILNVISIVYISLTIPEMDFIYIPITISRIVILLDKRYLFIYLLGLIPLPREQIVEYLLFSLILGTITFHLFDVIKRDRNSKMKILNLEEDKDKLSRLLQEAKESMEHKEYLLKLEERNKIAGKLHDEIGHTISGSIFQLEACNLIIDEDLPRAKKMIDSVATLLNSGINSIRSSLKSIKPETSLLGLQGIKAQLAEFRERSGIDITIDTESESEIPQKVWFITRENVKEFLTNTLKYSQATEVTFICKVLKGIIKIRISNNGNPEKVIVPGLGLRGMEERVNEAGGTLIVDGSNGFSITMIFKRNLYEPVNS